MKGFTLRLSLIAALAAATLTGPSALASSQTPVKSSLPTRDVRSVPPRAPQYVISTIAGGHRLDRSPTISTFASSPRTSTSTAPAVPQSPSGSRTVPGPVPALTDIFHVSTQQILINQDRVSYSGLAPLAWLPCLANIAWQNAQRIAAQGYLSHSNGPTLDLGCDPCVTTAGENIAYISSGIDDLQANTLFMNSAPHRANILNAAYRFIGTAWVVAPNGYGYIAVEFAG